MPKKESLIVAYILDGKGGGRRVDWDGVQSWTPDQGLLWVHLNYTSNKAKNWLKKESGIDHIAARAMTLSSDESRPRCVLHKESFLIFLRGVNLNPGEDPEDMVSIRMLIEKNRIITTRQRRLLSIDDIRETIESGQGPCSSSEFFIRLNDRLIHRMSDVIDQVYERVDSLEEAVISEESYLLRPQIAEIRRQSILIRRYLAPQREALNQLQLEGVPLLSRLDRMYLREGTDRIVRYIEDLDSARDRASIVQEELASRLSEQMNKRMYILALVAVIFLPLSFITGLLGINVGGIPGAEHQYGFAIVCTLLVILTIGIVFLLHRKKWM
ncbi:MAG: zinc transporter ZntB [Gammaproteobacteria bacterium]